MADRTSLDEKEELQKFQKALTPERAFKLVNNAIEVRLKSLSNVLPGEHILINLDVALPW